MHRFTRSRRARVCAFLLVPAVLAVGCEDRDTAGTPTVERPSPASPAGEVSPEVEQWQKLAEKHAPMVWLAKGDKNGPMDALTFIDNSDLWFDHGQVCADLKPVETDVDAGALGDGGYTHPATGELGPPPKGRQPACPHDDNTTFRSDQAVDQDQSGGHGFYLDLDNAKRKAGGPDAPAYWEYVPDGNVIVYWLFYPYNDFTNNHEGDWERVAVSFTGTDPTAVVFWRHELPTCQVPWEKFEKVDTHPVTYSAKGSHGSYYGEGAFGHAGGTDVTSKGREWQTWDDIRPTRTQPWFGYRGLWGDVGPRYFSGIPGPYPERNLDDAATTEPCHTVPEEYFGNWTGPVSQPSSDTDYRVRLGIHDGQVGDAVGTTFYPGLGCSGSLILQEITDEKLVVREVIAADPQLTCVREVTITLTTTPTGLHYASDGATAELVRE